MIIWAFLFRMMGTGNDPYLMHTYYGSLRLPRLMTLDPVGPDATPASQVIIQDVRNSQLGSCSNSIERDWTLVRESTS